MLSDIPKMRIVVCISILALILSCNKKSDLENQITITINSIDKETKKNRLNMFDTIEVRKEGIGYLMKTFNKVGEYVTDSTGSVKIKFDRSKKYQIRLYGVHIYGSNDIVGENLKNNQELNIEAFPVNW